MKDDMRPRPTLPIIPLVAISVINHAVKRTVNRAVNGVVTCFSVFSVFSVFLMRAAVSAAAIGRLAARAVLRRSRWRRFLTMVVLGCWGCSAVASGVTELQTAFNALTNTTRPGVYENQARGFMTAGGVSVSFPQRRVNMVSITPPQINAGCGGISLFLGGLSYISGEEFVAMLKGIAADSLGQAFAIAVRTLCPVCATVLSDLQKAAQIAANFAVDQCHAATALVEQGIESTPGLQQYVRTRAAQSRGQGGEEGGFLASLNHLTNNFHEALQQRVSDFKSLSEGATRQEALNRSPLGNTTWKALQGMTNAQKVFLMSVLGTTLSAPVSSHSSSSSAADNIETADGVKQVVVSPTLTVEALAKLLLFGSDAVMNRELSLLECPADHHGLWECLHPTPVNIKQSRWRTTNQQAVGGVVLARQGFYGLVYTLLQQAVMNVSENHPLGTAQSIVLPSALYGDHQVIKAHFSQEQIQGFMSIAELPLYRAVNLAAFYPAIAAQLLSNIAEVVAGHYAIAYLNHYVLTSQKTNGDTLAGEQGIDARLLQSLQRAIRRLRVDVAGQLTVLLTELQTQNAWVAQVNQLQTTVYQQVLHDGLDANTAYGLGMSGHG